MSPNIQSIDQLIITAFALADVGYPSADDIIFYENKILSGELTIQNLFSVINSRDDLRVNSSSHKIDTTMGEKAGKTFIDITTYLNWNRPAVGITRVLEEVIKFNIRNRRVEYVCFNLARDQIKVVSKHKVIELISLPIDAREDYNYKTSGKSPREKLCESILADFPELRIDPLLFEPFSNSSFKTLFAPENLIAKSSIPVFSSKDSLVLLGLDWQYSNYSLLLKLKARDNFNVIGAFYDGIPIERPDLLPDLNFCKSFYSHIYQLIYLCDKVFTISYFSKNQLLNVCQDAKITKRLKILPIYLGNGIDLPKKNYPISNKINLNRRHQKEYVLYVSTIESRKNHKLLLNVWHTLRKLQVKNIPDLIFVGMWGWGTEEIKSEYEKGSDLMKMIHVYGDVDDEELVTLYKNAKFCVFPSLMEGWGLGASEALGFGVPCIISTAPALVEATQNLMPSLDPNDIDLWTKEITMLISHPSKLDKLKDLIYKKYQNRKWINFSQDFMKFALGK